MSDPRRSVLARPSIIIAAARPEFCEHCEVRHSSVCAALEDSDLHVLARIASHASVARGSCILSEGQPARYFFNITRGVAKLYKSLADGRRQIIGFLRAGDFVGLAAERLYGFSAEALDDLTVCRFDRECFDRSLLDLPSLERRLLDVACHELVAAQNQMLLLGRKSATERLATFLLHWAERDRVGCDKQAAGPTTLALPMTRGDIADYLGLTTETVSRTLSGLRHDGLISGNVGGRELTITDQRRLARFAAVHS